MALRRSTLSSSRSGPVSRLVLDNCGHSLHKDQSDAALSAVADFLSQIRDAPRLPERRFHLRDSNLHPAEVGEHPL